MKHIVEIYRSPKKEGAYLYLPMQPDLSSLPAPLLALFGQPQLSMKLVITPDKVLAQTTGEKVLEAIQQQGFFLQLPKPEESEMTEIAAKNSKLPR